MSLEQQPKIKKRANLVSAVSAGIAAALVVVGIVANMNTVVNSAYTTAEEAAYYIQNKPSTAKEILDYRKAIAACNNQTFSVPYTAQVAALYQLPELDSGCEAVALTIALRAYGFELEKTDIWDNYLEYDKTDWVNKYAYTVGQCMPPAIVKAANTFLSSHNSDLRAFEITGASLDELFEYVDAGYPVLVWITIDMTVPNIEFEEAGYVFVNAEHCVCLYGHTSSSMDTAEIAGTGSIGAESVDTEATGSGSIGAESADTESKADTSFKEYVLVSDPLAGLVQYERQTFESIYNTMNRPCVVIL